MGLNILNFFNFFNMPPKIPYLFDVVFRTWGANANKYIPPSWSVQSVKLPVMEAADNEFNVFLGDGRATVPLWNPASRTLEITFEETDDMKITKFINTLAYEQYVKGLIHYVAIKVTDYQPAVPFALTYICRLKDYTDVQFANGGSANVGTVTATFIVITTHDSNDAGSEDKINKVLEENRLYSLNNGIADFNVPVIEPPGKNITPPQQTYSRKDYDSKDLEFDEAELAKQNEHLWFLINAGVAFKNLNLKDTEENRRIMLEYLSFNAKETSRKMKLFLDAVKAAGIDIGITEVNGVLYADNDPTRALHEFGLDARSGSHLFNAKVDAQTSVEQGRDFTEAQKQTMYKLGDDYGIAVNFESDTGFTRWVDLATLGALVPITDGKGNLISQLDKNGKPIKTAKVVNKAWVERGKTSKRRTNQQGKDYREQIDESQYLKEKAEIQSKPNQQQKSKT